MPKREFDLITFGEAMVRLSPPGSRRLEQADLFDVKVGGGELNVAVASARLGFKCAWISALPDNPLGKMVRNKVREQGVDTSYIIFSTRGRQGLYFVEFGASPRASQVLYDRQYSSISMIQPSDIEWDKIFSQSKAFHVSGITPALSKTAAETTQAALKAAKKNRCLVSYDLNYRAKLWTTQEANKCQTPLMDYVDILITTEEDTNKVFGLKGKNYEETARKLANKFGFKAVAITLRGDLSVLKNTWTAIAFSEGKIYRDKTYEVEIVDRVGAGDSFSAGFLYGYLSGGVEKGLQYGNALAAIKHSIPGDFCWSDRKEVEALIQGGTLRIVR
ncbi:MAG: sugar kinase [Dehalococcoidia bacterium]|jgi:2-dehydro-3-deoxygluconokinase